MWRDQEAILLLPQDTRLAPLRDGTLQTHSAMLAPLVFAHQNLGVIAIANGPLSLPFTETDFSTFKAIAEQSAFALYNAMIYLLADEKKRMDSDLQVAQEIQRILLPSAAPTVRNYEIDGINMPGAPDERRLLRLYARCAWPLGSRHRGCLRQGGARLAHHGHVPQRPSRPGRRQDERRRGPQPGQPPDLSGYQGRHVHLDGLSSPR